MNTEVFEFIIGFLIVFGIGYYFGKKEREYNRRKRELSLKEKVDKYGDWRKFNQPPIKH